MKRLFLSFFFICLSFYSVSTLAQDTTSISVDSFHIQGGVKGLDQWYGFTDSVIVVRVMVVPQKESTTGGEQKDSLVFDSCVVYRTYKEETVKIGVFSEVKTDSIVHNDSIKAVLGEKDYISYDVEFFYRKYTRESNDSVWGKPDSITEKIETRTLDFSIFEKPRIEDEKFTVPNLKTYAGGPVRSFALAIDSLQNGYDKGWKIEWLLDETLVSDSTEYTFDTKNEVSGEKTLSAKIRNVAPDGTTVLYDKDWSWDIKIYANPATAKSTTVGPESKYACVEVHKDRTYNSSVKMPDGYGSWKYEWYLKDKKIGTDSIINYNFPNEAGTYDLNLILAAFNPDDNMEEWYKDTITLETITIFPEPKVGSIELHNFVYKDDDTISLQIATSGGCKEGWSYQWYKKASLSSSADVELSGDSILSFICENDGDEKLEESLYCVVSNYVDKTELYSNTIPLSSQIEIYPTPEFVPQDIHRNENAHPETYSLYEDQLLDPEVLKGKFGGQGGYPDGWKYELWVEGELKKDFRPATSGSYEVAYKVSNTATLTDGSKTVWFEKSFEYTFDVLKTPDITETMCYTEEGNDTENFDGEEELHVVKGTTIQVQLEGIGGCPNSWATEWVLYRSKNQKDITVVNKKNHFTAEFETDTESSKDSIHYLIKYKICNNPLNHVNTGSDNSFIKEGEKRIVVWRDINTQAPGVKINDTSTNTIYIETYEGADVSLTIQNVGGASARWNNTWTPQEGSPKGERTDYGQKYNLSNLQSANGKPSTYSYTVVSKYGVHSDMYNFVVIVWPKPVLKAVELKLNKADENISYNIDDYTFAPECYEEDKFTLQYSLEGGIMDEDRNVWKCIVTDEDDICYDLEEKSGEIPLNAAQLKVKFVHNYDGRYNSTIDDWLIGSNEYTIDPKIYKQPTIEEQFTDSANVEWGKKTIYVYEGQLIKMNYKLNEGYSDGWEVVWVVDGKTLPETDKGKCEYSPELVSGTNLSEDKTIEVTIKNRIGNNVGLHEVKEYPIRVWRKANFKNPSIIDCNNSTNEISGTTINVREGNMLKLNVDPIEYGYENKSYTWNIAGRIINEKDIETSMTMNNDSPEFGNESQTIKFKAQVNGPYGKEWDNKEITYYVNVYNKPKTPTKLKKKGSGVSGTLICETELTDKDLEKYEYYLVYGYEENGKDVDFASVKQENPGMVRWALAPSNGVLSKDNIYVYALWKDETVEITSGKKYISGVVDEYWDGSTYNGSTRAVLNNNHTKIDDIVADVPDGIEIVQIYSLDGVAVGQNLGALPGGMYIISYMSNGNEMKSRKIVIK